MLRDGFLAPNINFTGQREDDAPINVLREIQRGEVDTIMCNSFGFGGTNACLILKRFAD